MPPERGKQVEGKGMRMFASLALGIDAPCASCSVLVVVHLPGSPEVPGSNRAADKKFMCFSRKSLRYAALGTGCTLTAVPRSTQPSTLRGMVNEYKPYGCVIIYGDGRMFDLYSRLQVDSTVKFAAWPTSWRPPGADRLSSI